tara:strand:- start:7693 stop:8400 length:708 start_codon:yes stop_codon:yes gene_type:complete
MIKSNRITIISVSDIKIKKTINALIKSTNQLRPYETIFFTSKSIKLSPIQKKYIRKIEIDPISSIEEYSKFIIFSLHKFIDTTHVLIVQWDGFITNINKWDKDFLKYDYIGAPFIPRINELNYSKDKEGRFYTIGNGGFSLRSKKLLEAATKFNLKDNKLLTNYHEDGFFSVLHRNFLESKGFIWAPFNIAKNFSIESPLSFNDLKELPLGFHGKKMLLIIFLKKLLEKIKSIFL